MCVHVRLCVVYSPQGNASVGAILNQHTIVAGDLLAQVSQQGVLAAALCSNFKMFESEFEMNSASVQVSSVVKHLAREEYDTQPIFAVKQVHNIHHSMFTKTVFWALTRPPLLRGLKCIIEIRTRLASNVYCKSIQLSI